MREMIPSGMGWVRENVRTLKPGENKILLENGDEYTYDQVRKLAF